MNSIPRIIPIIILTLTQWTNCWAQDNMAINSHIPPNSEDVQVYLPKIIIANIPTTITLDIKNKEYWESLKNGSSPILINNQIQKFTFSQRKVELTHIFTQKESLYIRIDTFHFQKYIRPIPLWCSILPPLIAIIMALVFREVYSALFVGILSGTLIIHYHMQDTLLTALFKSIFSISDTYLLKSMADGGHISIIIFSMLIGAMVNLITQNGGMQGIVNKLARYANTPPSGQFITWLLGVIIFFDDYANTLVVGNTMREVTDRLKISREKLAYIVDSTAAPVASVAMITTWIGIELSYIQSATDQIGVTEAPYTIFLRSLPTRFYPFFTLAFILILVWKKRDFGPMYKAEQQARLKQVASKSEKTKNYDNSKNSSAPSSTCPARWYNAGIPVLIVVIGTLAGLFYTGWDPVIWNNTDIPFSTKLSQIIGASDSYLALLWSSLSGVLAAVALTLSQGILSLKDSMESLINGFKTMLTAIIILILAWALAHITQDMHTADFIARGLIASEVSPILLPTFTFILSAIIAFSTGSSWGTMAILYPLILPASFALCISNGMTNIEAMNIFYIVVSAILAGSVLGDHCSPISDTTILSSLASSCNHIEHVRTQLPYALTVGTISIVAGLLPAAFGISSWILIPLGFVLLYTVVIILGKKTNK